MSLYEKYILPKVINCVCGLKPMMRQRGKIVPEAKGKVLEIGIGSGLNLSYYDRDKVNHIIGIDPTPEKKHLMANAKQCSIPFDFMQCGAEQLDIADRSIDTIVSTYTFCTIPDLTASLKEIKRVLKPSGEVLFIEHGKAPEAKIQKTQDRINPYWKKIAGGCHLNRDIPYLLTQAGFGIDKLDSMYLPGWKPATFNVWGKASFK